MIKFNLRILYLFSVFIFLGAKLFAQTTIDFESTGYVDNEKLGKSVEISGFTFSINSTDPNDEILFDNNNPVGSGSGSLTDNNLDVGGITQWTIAKTDGSEFQLRSIYIKDSGVGSSTSGTIKVYKNNSQVGTTVNITFDGNQDFTSNSDFYDIDEIRIGAADINFFIDDLVYGGVLPVELTTFSAKISDSNVILNWQTATEVNNYGFDVERRSDNEVWKKIGFVQGSGNSNSPKKYSYIDKPNAGSSFNYRLKQIDTDGKYVYSPEVEVKLEDPADFSVKQNFPNPFNPATMIEYSIPSDNNVEIKVFNVLGMEVATLLNENEQAGVHSVEFDASNLSSGIYFYKIVSGNYYEIKKMILLR